MPKRNIVPARNRMVERLAEAIAHAKRHELIDDLGWLFTSEPQDADIEETSNLVRQVDKVVKGSDDVPCVLGRESANLIGLEGVAKGSADVSCVLGGGSANSSDDAQAERENGAIITTNCYLTAPRQLRTTAPKTSSSTKISR